MASSRACRSHARTTPSRASRCLVLALSMALAAPGQQDPPGGAAPPAPSAFEAAQAAARPRDADELFRHFAALRGLAATFTERKHLSLLAVPLESRGALYFLPPGHLARVVEAPEPCSVTITAAELRMRDATGVEVLDLRQSDRVRLFVTSLLRVFQGDRDALAAHYRVRYEPDPDDGGAWRLVLTPRGEPLDRILTELALAGRGRAVREITWLEPGGDRTVTTIVTAEPDRVFTEAERRDLFGIEPDGSEGAKK